MTPVLRSVPYASVCAALLLAIAPVAGAQSATAARRDDPQAILRAETFVRPPEDVERMILTPRTSIAFDAPNADRSLFLRPTGPDRGDIKDYGKAHLNLAGVQVDPTAARARSLSTSRARGLEVVDPSTGRARALQVPDGASIAGETWSPDGRSVAYIANFATASHAYVADVATGRSTQVTRTPLLATLVTGLRFTADGRQLLVVLVPEGRGAAPTHGPGGVEDGPQVRLTEGASKPQPVHASLLQDPHDRALLAYHTTGQLALVDVRSRAVRRIGAPAMIRAVDVSADSRHFRVTRMLEPFSYLVPASSFATVQELWDLDGRTVTTLASTPLREEGRGGFGGGGPAAGSDTGRRNLQWDPHGPGLVYLQTEFGATAPNGGGARGGAPAGAPGGARTASAARPQAVATRYVRWAPPFGPTDTTTLFRGGPQLTNVLWSADGRTMFVNDSGAVAAVRVVDPARKYPLGRGVTMPGPGGGGFGGGGGQAAAADTVGTGGALATREGANGQRFVVATADGRSVFVSGSRQYGADWHRRAPRPWTDRLEIETGTRARVFDGPADAYERVETALDDDHTRLIITRQSPTEIENAWLLDTRTGARTRLTNAVDVGPEVSLAQRKRVQVTRPRDGTRVWVDVTLPRDWRPGSRLPGIIWFYPREFATAQAYERSRHGTNINLFRGVPAARPASATELWVTQGYALITPDVPIFGDSGRMNDNYTRDLQENLDAVVDAMVDSGFVDRARMGIGGHSYGAFSTVNAMTLVPYFKAGIAGDGMYNRSLTPFGFQSERRNFYEAQATYLDMSPFFRADKLAGALLLYHGSDDQNTGTAPLSSWRMMAALQGLGKTAALYMYPYEDHSVATYQSDLDMWARWFAWFDVHVKSAGQDATSFTP